MSYLTDPTKRTGSCGMIARRDRRSSSPMLEMSRSSIAMEPDDGSARRNNALTNDDLPDTYCRQLVSDLPHR